MKKMILTSFISLSAIAIIAQFDLKAGQQSQDRIIDINPIENLIQEDFLNTADDIFASLNFESLVKRNTLNSPLAAPFECATEFYFTLDGDLLVLDPANLPAGMQFLFDLGSNVNATGYNPVDDYIYTFSSGGTSAGHALRIHSDGTIDDLGDIGLSTNPNVGAFDPLGLWYVTSGGSSTISIIDLTTMSFTTTTANQAFVPFDWTYHYQNKLFYGAHGNTLYFYDPASNQVNNKPITGFSPQDGVTYGAALYTSDGYIYVLNNTTGYLYRINVDTGEALLVFEGTGNYSSVDACACPSAPPPLPIVTASPDSFCLDQQGMGSYFILYNDVVNFGSLDVSTFVVVTPPQHGTVSFDFVTGELSYIATGTPELDSLVYEICSDGITVICDQATVYVFPPDEISFDPFGPYCLGDTPDDLPPTSNEGIPGNWIPAVISTDSPGSYTYTFMPDNELNPCAYPLTISVTISELEYPGFDSFGPYCQYVDPGPLPDISNEGIPGIWYPEAINTDIPGVYTFTFTPDYTLHPCAQEEIIVIVVNEEITPTFNSFGPYCVGEEPDVLFPISNEGVIGNWSPEEINTDLAGDYTYTFTPDPEFNPCALADSIIISVIELEIPTFDSIGSYCVNDVPGDLPVLSNEGIVGSWNPDTIDTSIPGLFQFIFTPDDLIHPCGLEVSIEIAVNDAMTPSFNDPGAFCLNETPVELPAVSFEGIAGNWNPSVISTSTPGILEYLFTPDSMDISCAQETTLDITVLPAIQIDLIDKLCSQDLLSYDLVIQITGGSGNYLTVGAESYEIVDMGGGYYTIKGILSDSGTTIEVWDDEACSSLISTIPHDCSCPEVSDPTGGYDLVYCSGEDVGTINIDDPGPGYQINWYDEVGLLLSNQNPFTPPGPGIYSATLVDSVNGCESSNPLSITVSEIPPIQIDPQDIDCATDLLSYELEVLITGGTGNFTQVFADGYLISNNGAGSYTIHGIPNATGVDILIEDDMGCGSTLSTLPHDCTCSYIAPPAGEQIVYFCYGDEPPPLYVSDPENGYDVQWYDGDNNFTGSGPIYLPDAPGLFYAEIIDTANNCTSERTTIELIENEEIILTVLSEICADETGPFDLLVLVSGGTPNYLLKAGGNTITSSSTTDFTIKDVPDNGGLGIVITDNLGCTIESWAAPEILASPGADAGPEKFISCTDATAILNASADKNNVSYKWIGPDPDFDTQSAKPVVDIPGIYYLLVTDSINGCSSTDSTIVHNVEFPDFELDIIPIPCHGEETGIILFQSVSNGSPPYFYSIDGGISYTSDPTFEQLPAGMFELIVQDSSGCKKDSLVFLYDPEPLTLHLESPIQLSIGETHQIIVETNLSNDAIASIIWIPPDGLSCVDCLEPIANPDFSTSYLLELIDTLGCWVQDSILIIREKENDIYIPNVFSPNGDMVNDIFYIKGGNGVKTIKSLEIFNRWGNKLFSVKNFPPNDPGFGWDGTAKNQLITPDVFVYYAEIQFIDGRTIIYSGDLTLLR